jgi:hypothetical protein
MEGLVEEEEKHSKKQKLGKQKAEMEPGKS